MRSPTLTTYHSQEKQGVGKRSGLCANMTIRRLQSFLSLTEFFLISIFLSTGIAADQFPDKVSIQYAKGFRVEYHDSYKVLTVLKPWNQAQTMFQYVLVPRGNPRPSGYEEFQYIDIPLRSIVTMSTTYLKQLSELQVLDTLVGHSNFQYINTPEVINIIKEGRIEEVGDGINVNIELLMDLSPDGSNSLRYFTIKRLKPKGSSQRSNIPIMC